MADLLHDLGTGAVLSGRYRLEQRLGSGATAAVWRARDLDLGRPVAVKLLLGNRVTPELAMRFEREAMLLERVSHPSIVRVLATGEHEGRRYLVMELVDGQPLSSLLEGGPLDVDEAVAIVADVAAGLAAAHAAGVVHRDVKPSNILCTPAGAPCLVDFGIARADDLTTITAGDLVVGTAAYLSPEQARGEVPGAASDVYALGCVLYEGVTGRPPFEGASAVAVAHRHVHDTPAPLTAAPAAVAAVVERCLAKDPADRFRDAGELEAALRAAADPAVDHATTTVAIPPVRDATMVLPAVATAGASAAAVADGELIDASPLAPVERREVEWGRVGAVAAAVVLLVVIALSLAGGGGDRDSPSTTDSSLAPRPSIASTTIAPPTTAAPAPAPVVATKRPHRGKHGKG